MRPSRLWSLLLLPGGLATGHALGYAGARVVGATPSLEGGHGYIEGLFCLAVPFTLAVLGRAVLAGTRTELAPVRFGLLASLQVACFVGVEVAEHASAGIGPSSSLREASLLLGVLAQIGVAWLVCALIRAANRVAARIATRTSDRRRRSPQPILLPVDWVAAFAVAVSSLSRRGPPAPVAA